MSQDVPAREDGPAARRERASEGDGLRERIGRYRMRYWAAAALALTLGAALALSAADVFEDGASLLGTGRAGVMTAADSARVDSLRALSAGVEVVGHGEASYYGHELAGNPTASGEPFDPTALTAAHRTLPLGSTVRVTNLNNGEAVTVRINDRGPFHAERILDLSRRAAERIDLLTHGKGRVKIELLNKK